MVTGREISRPGSSPLARGGPPPLERCQSLQRLIPAGAGRTSAPSSRRSARTAHPRWRGEDNSRRPHAPAGEGSSPLARGGPEVLGHQAVIRGLIPAGAGRTRPPCRVLDCMWAHPRWRGEDAVNAGRCWWLGGSSPLARGGRVAAVVALGVQGLIPAGAGRTRLATSAAAGITAHPRWRGEDSSPSTGVSPGHGSSPLARGGRKD